MRNRLKSCFEKFGIFIASHLLSPRRKDGKTNMVDENHPYSSPGKKAWRTSRELLFSGWFAPPALSGSVRSATTRGSDTWYDPLKGQLIEMHNFRLVFRFCVIAQEDAEDATSSDHKWMIHILEESSGIFPDIVWLEYFPGGTGGEGIWRILDTEFKELSGWISAAVNDLTGSMVPQPARYYD